MQCNELAITCQDYITGSKVTTVLKITMDHTNLSIFRNFHASSTNIFVFPGSKTDSLFSQGGNWPFETYYRVVIAMQIDDGEFFL